jgi:hypothetical protein
MPTEQLRYFRHQAIPEGAYPPWVCFWCTWSECHYNWTIPFIFGEHLILEIMLNIVWIWERWSEAK